MIALCGDVAARGHDDIAGLPTFSAVAAFYQDGVGLTRLKEDDDGVVLGSAGAPLLALLHRPELPNPSAGAAGLFHTAVLFEERSALAAALYATATKFGESFTGSADHLVSLAFYFDDPAGNMVEVYWPTGRACHQPYGDPIDLADSEEALLRDVERFPLPVDGRLSVPEVSPIPRPS